MGAEERSGSGEVILAVLRVEGRGHGGAASSPQMLGVGLDRAFACFGQHLVDAFVLQSFLLAVQQVSVERTADRITVKQLLYFLNKGSHSSAEEWPLIYSAKCPLDFGETSQVAICPNILSEYHFKKQVSYFLLVVSDVPDN